jgi:uroporphyrin-3 C-methyltransferase
MMEHDALTSPARPDRTQRLLAILRQPAVWVAVAALGLLAWQVVDSRSRIGELQQEVARRLAAGDAAANEARIATRQNQEALAALQAKAGALEAKLAESQSQQAALDAMVQELTRNRDERLLAEIEQALNTAAQQLQLAGNVEAALIALQGADARLGAAGRAQLLPLRKVIARDIERLKALPLADVPGIALRIESIVGSVDAMPLAFEARPSAEPAKASFVPAAAAGYWATLLDELWRELKSLIRIERLDRPDPALLSPSHAFFLRENLKLRLVNARLALLQRDGKSFQQDVRLAQTWIEKYYDTRARPVQAALATLRQLAAADVGLALPGLQESLTTLRNFKVARERESLPSAPRPKGADGASAARGAAGSN